MSKFFMQFTPKLSIAIVFAALCFTEILAADATINLSSEKQVIRGYGGMNHPAWVGDLTEAQRLTAFGNGDNQLGLSVLRIYVDDNRNNWQRDLTTAKWATDRGGILVFASPWNPPESMREKHPSYPNDNHLKTSSYAAYTTHLNDFVSYMLNNGVNLHAISVQNEPDHPGWTRWSNDELLTFMKNHAGNIDSRVKVISPEPFQYEYGQTKPMLSSILNDATALANTDIFATHFYGTPVSSMPFALFKQKGAGKDLWMTEVYHPNSDHDANTWPEALDVAQHVHNAMVEGEMQMYVWWYIRRYYSLIHDGQAPSKGANSGAASGTITKRGWMIGHFSKFVRPGYVRIDATKNPETDVYVSAYKGGNKFVIVAVNKKTTAVNNQKFTISGAIGAQVEAWRTSQNQNMAKIANISASSGSFTASLPAQSVTTFVGEISGVNVNIDVTCNVGNTGIEPYISYAAGSAVPRPNITCSEGAPGIAAFTVDGNDISGWNAPGGSHRFYNVGTRNVALNNVMCGTISVPVSLNCGSFEIEASSTDITATCDVNNLQASYVAGAAVPRPNIVCSEGEAGTASFTANGSNITGWAQPGGTHQLYNLGNRTIVLNNVMCGATAVSSELSCGSFEIIGSPIEITCNIDNLEPSYASGSEVPRPSVTCSAGEPGTALFVDRSPITGWAQPGGTHRLYNTGTRDIVLSELVCGATNVILNPAISCGTFEIEEDAAPIAKMPLFNLNSSYPVVIYNLKGNKVASSNVSGIEQIINLPLPSGVYIAKVRGMPSKMFVVK